MEDLIEWTQSADKTAVASLSPVVFTAAELGSKEMMGVLQAGAGSLAKYTASVAKWLEFEMPDVRLQGGIFLNQPLYVELYREALAPILATSSVNHVTRWERSGPHTSRLRTVNHSTSRSCIPRLTKRASKS